MLIIVKKYFLFQNYIENRERKRNYYYMNIKCIINVLLISISDYCFYNLKSIIALILYINQIILKYKNIDIFYLGLLSTNRNYLH